MHLLSRTPDGVLRLTEFPNKNNVPPYAVLSHRWESDEPTFQDIALPSSRMIDPAGISKLHFCGKQAAKDGYSYFWVDTACIDKTNMVQLTEAINSMFRWYQQAEKCYVYMSDVDGLENFEKSVWFTRGWTLQELVAPHTVEFFCRKGQFLGTKRTLEEEIATVTRIPPSALRNADLEDFSIEERMLWSSHRETTREEDKAYCLMGIFNVFMSAIYGEGDNAFDRLERKIAKRGAKSRVHSPTEVMSPDDRSIGNEIRRLAPTFAALRATGGSPPPPTKEQIQIDDYSDQGEGQQLTHEYVVDAEYGMDIRPEDSISLYGQNKNKPSSYLQQEPSPYDLQQEPPSSYLLGEVNKWLSGTDPFPIVHNLGFNCFGTITVGGALSFGASNRAKCKRCKFRYHLNSELAKGFDEPYLLVSGGEVRPVALSLLLSRFHHAGTRASGFRCFICKVYPPITSDLYSWEEMQDHLQEKHSYEQICNDNLGIYDI